MLHWEFDMETAILQGSTGHLEKWLELIPDILDKKQWSIDLVTAEVRVILLCSIYNLSKVTYPA